MFKNCFRGWGRGGTKDLCGAVMYVPVKCQSKNPVITKENPTLGRGKKKKRKKLVFFQDCPRSERERQTRPGLWLSKSEELVVAVVVVVVEVVGWHTPPGTY